MNNVYFGCTNCKTYVDAGYRWAYWQLDKSGVVAQGEVANIDRLLSTDSYWRPQDNEQSSWLTSTLAHAEKFVISHKAHQIVYGDMEHLVGPNAEEYERFAWMNENPGYTDLLPRNFIEQMGISTWAGVESYI